MTDLVGAVIERKRGDTAPDKITDIDEDTGLPRDNTGFSYRMTLNTVKDPDPTHSPPIGTELFEITGTPGGADGTVEFPWTPAQADQAIDTYWYDIERTDSAGKHKTIAKNEYRFFMDVGKTN